MALFHQHFQRTLFVNARLDFQGPPTVFGKSVTGWVKSIAGWVKIIGVITPLGGGNSNMFYFHPENWGNHPI